MRNLIILGAGRSGTSAVAALFQSVPDVFYGHETLKPTSANPKGYFEDEVVNTINNLLLRQMTGTMLLDLAPLAWLPWIGSRFSWMHRDTRSLWLARPRRPLPWRLGYDLAHLMTKVTAHAPFCLKDPRFSFTLPYWRPYLPEGARFLVVFRDPAQTVRSVMKDAKTLYEPPLALTEPWAIEHWNLANCRLLEQRANDNQNNWMFINIRDVVSGAALGAIETFADCKVDHGQIIPGLLTEHRLEGADAVTRQCHGNYSALEAVAKLDLARWSRLVPAAQGAPDFAAS